MSYPFTVPKQTFFDGGVIAAAGTIEFRSPSTNALIDTFPTADDADAQTNANDNPLTLDANGQAVIFLEDDVTYKVILKNVNGDTVWTVDDVRSPERIDTGSYTPSGGVSRTLASKLDETVSVTDFGAVGDGITDDLTALQAAADSGELVYFPPGIYAVSDSVNFSDYTRFIGASAFYKRRTGYTYSANKHAVIKYIGSGGTNSCAVRVSATSVGVVGSDFTAPSTDDLVDYRLEHIHIDGNNLAQYPLYIYRAGNQKYGINDVTVERGTINVVMLGCFAANFGRIGSFEASDKGFSIGRDIFGWGGAEFNCFDLRADLIASNNGTDGTFVAETTDEDGCGVLADVGRGSELHITSEGNDGRSAIIGGTSSGGPATIHWHYLEGNGAGPRVDLRPGFTGLRFKCGFLHPGSATITKETIYLVGRNSSGAATTNEGPIDEGEWPIFENIGGKSGNTSIYIDSNTYKYDVRDSTGVKFIDKAPKGKGVFCSGTFLGDSGLTDIRMLRGQTIYDDFEGDGSTTAFTLSHTCTAPTNNSTNPLVRVYVNGVLQTYTTHYTVAGTTLTFVTAPTYGVKIRAEYSNASLTRTGAGAYTITFGHDQVDENYHISLTMIQGSGSGYAYVQSRAADSFTIRTVNPATPGTPVDLGAGFFISFSCSYSGTDL